MLSDFIYQTLYYTYLKNTWLQAMSSDFKVNILSPNPHFSLSTSSQIVVKKIEHIKYCILPLHLSNRIVGISKSENKKVDLLKRYNYNI